MYTCVCTHIYQCVCTYIRTYTTTQIRHQCAAAYTSSSHGRRRRAEQRRQAHVFTSACNHMYVYYKSYTNIHVRIVQLIYERIHVPILKLIDESVRSRIHQQLPREEAVEAERERGTKGSSARIYQCVYVYTYVYYKSYTNIHVRILRLIHERIHVSMLKLIFESVRSRIHQQLPREEGASGATGPPRRARGTRG